MRILNRFLVFFLGFIFSINGYAQGREPLKIKMDFESYDPPSTLITEENYVTHAKFPFVDIHSHHWRMDEQDLHQLITEMDSLNMQVCVNLSGRGGARLKAIMDNIDKHGYRDRIIVFTNINIRSIDDPDWTESTLAQMEHDAANGAKGLKIYKSQGMTHTDNAGNRIAINDPRLDPIWEKCAELDFPVLIHAADPKSFWDPLDSLNERWLELKLKPTRKRDADNPAAWEEIIAEQHDVFKRHPNTTFINAHFGWHANDLKTLGTLLEAMPNMYIECGAIIAELGRQPRAAKAFLTKYQDRILFGKDSYKPKEYYTYFRVLETADEYFPYYKRYHAFWRMYGLDLDDEVLQKMYFKNAAKLLRLDLTAFSM